MYVMMSLSPLITSRKCREPAWMGCARIFTWVQWQLTGIVKSIPPPPLASMAIRRICAETMNGICSVISAKHQAVDNCQNAPKCTDLNVKFPKLLGRVIISSNTGQGLTRPSPYHTPRKNNSICRYKTPGWPRLSNRVW